jgi:4-amino-4-deoxy-L-arabinose transferase-like glycosyltransferase
MLDGRSSGALSNPIHDAIAPTLSGLRAITRTSAGWMPLAFVALTAARLAFISHLPLLSDEAYYWQWSERLALSYFDHPPLVAFCVAASTHLFGRTELAVHLPAVLFAAATSLVLLRLILLLFPGQARLAWASVLLLNCAPLLAMGAVFTTPDAPLAFFWVLTLYLFRRALEGERYRWWLAGLCTGLGLLSKYNMVLLLPGMLVFLATSRHRHWLGRREPWIALAIALLCLAPVLAWNAEHDWASLSFQLVQRHRRAFTPLLNFRRFVVSQFAISPLLLAACLWGALRSAKRARSGEESHWFLLCASGSVLLFFAVAGFFSLTLPNWSVLGWVTLFPAAVQVLRETRSRRFAYATAGLAAAASGLFYFQSATLAFPLPRGLDLAVNQHGWQEARRKVEEVASGLPLDSFIATDRFQSAALAAFYWPGHRVTRMGGSRTDQYDFWRDPSLLGHDAVYFCENCGSRLPKSLPFRSCDDAGSWDFVLHGRTLRTLSFWRCRELEPNVRDSWASSAQGAPVPGDRDAQR